MKSSLRFFFTTAVVLLALGAISDLAWHYLAQHILKPNGGAATNGSYDLSLADYYLSIGDVETAITKYNFVADTEQPPIKTMAVFRLDQTIRWQQSTAGRLTFFTAWLSWNAYPRLYGLGGLMVLIWVLFLLYRWKNKRPSFAILPLLNSTDIDGVGKLPTLVIERMHEIHWRTKAATGTITKLIAEQLEIPTIGLADDAKSINLDNIVETAWAITSGFSNLSLVDLMRSLRLWINPPKYIINGSLHEVNGNIQLRLFLQSSDTDEVEKNWQLDIPEDQKSSALSTLVDDIAFALFHNFNENVSTRKWRALQASTNGIFYFELYFTDKRSTWLGEAQRALESAIRIDPDYLVARYNLGLIFMTMGEFNEARAVLKPMTLK